MATENFYANLPTLKNFLEITQAKQFVPAPEDWYIAVTDIVNSTQAIESGRYKEVNLLGASSIAAVTNVASPVELPFVFGGDGASILIPPALYAKTSEALLATRQVAQQAFGMDLRIGIVPIADVVANGKYSIKVAKLQVSQTYCQAMFMGGGLSYATELVKDAATASRYELKPQEAIGEPNFSGLKCRWNDIPSQYGETISLLIMAMGSDETQNQQIYKTALQKIYDIYGDERYLHPIAPQQMKLSFDFKKLGLEAKLKSIAQPTSDHFANLRKIVGENLGYLLNRINPQAEGWQKFRQNIAEASDYRKFDDTLRMVIAGSPSQRQQLTSHLESGFKAGKLVYGLHVADRALMTCLFFDGSEAGNHVHFIDGADGGYAAAAKAMKQRMQPTSSEVSNN